MKQRNGETGKLVREKFGMIDFGENIIIIWILDKSGSVELKSKLNWFHLRYLLSLLSIV